MSLSDKIKAGEDTLVTLKDQLTDATKALETDDADETALALVEELADKVEKQAASVAALKKAEQALMSKSQQVRGGSAPSVIQHRGTNVKGNAADLLFKSALVAFESGIRHISPDQVIQERYNGDDQVKAVSSIVVKAAQNPSMSNVPGYAQELVMEGHAAFLDLLKPTSVLAALNLKRYSFDGFGSLKIPVRTGSSTSTPNASGHFRGEGGAIRIGAISLGSKTMTPKSFGIITTFTQELLARSTPSIESILKDAMISDSSEALDRAFLSNTAASAIVPGGMLAGILPANTAVSAGTSVANMQADIKGRLTQIASLNLGSSLAWVMNPARKYGLALAQNAVGAPAFPSVGQSNTLYGAPIITSTTVPATDVFLIEQAAVAGVFDSPVFDFSNVATLHEESDPAVVASDISAANPIRSLFQTNSSAIKLTMGLDWAILRDGAVQSISACNW